MVEDLAPTRSLARHPLFQVMLTLQNNTQADLDLPGVESELLSAGTLPAKFDLDLVLQEQFGQDGEPGGMEGTVVFATDLFDRDTVEVMAGRLVRVLEAISTHPDQPLSQVDVLSEAERRQLLVEWNDTAVDYPRTTLPALFEAQAAATPDAVAVTAGETELTYRQLNEQANRLARLLIDHGVGPESLVAVLMHRSPDLIVTLLAVLKAGAAYVPIDARSPVSRMKRIFQETAAQVLIVDSRTSQHEFTQYAAAANAVVLPAGTDTGVADATNPPARCVPDQAAYVMYTSGSTGTPKGIITTHHGVTELARDTCWHHPHTQHVLQHSPHAFDASTYEIWIPLLSGGQVIVAPDTDLDATVIRSLITRHKLTHIHLTAGLFRVIAEEDPDCFTGIHEVSTGGDIVPPLAAQRILEASPETVVRNTYGPTEITLCATHIPIDRHTPIGQTLPIGHPMDNTQLYVLNDALQPVAPGVSGELYIAGDGLARG
ncbi:AMP-binding protein, partial [Streptomyces griseoviridis]|uniref:non-ribosomal peptide synthetase n=1 Tax=Streptomyces griseoviridis TaxID=45398 RepID=UPI0033DD9AA1